MRKLTRAGFSLVEISLALGIATFCLVAIFSLLAVGLRGNLESSEETVATGILSQVAADLRSCPTSSPPGAATNTAQFKIAIPANPVNSEISASPLYFGDANYQGTAAESNSRFRVEITFLANGATNAATLALLKVAWPAAATNATGTVETLVAMDRN